MQDKKGSLECDVWRLETGKKDKKREKSCTCEKKVVILQRYCEYCAQACEETCTETQRKKHTIKDTKSKIRI